jgi:uncharacterized membrane protein
MLKKAKTTLELFKAGKRVSDPAKWKARQIEASVLVAAIWAAVNAASAFGIEIPVDADTVDAAAVAVLAIVNVVLTVTTTNKIGLPGEPKP